MSPTPRCYSLVMLQSIPKRKVSQHFHRLLLESTKPNFTSKLNIVFIKYLLISNEIDRVINILKGKTNF